QCASCEALAALRATTFNLTGDGPPERVGAAKVSFNFFALLGVQPQLGRGFVREEDHPGSDVVIISDSFWRRRFLADPSIIGKTVELNGNRQTVIGVLPASFVPPKGFELNPIVDFGRQSDIFAPVAFVPEELRNRMGNFNYAVVARIKSG